MKIEIDTHVHSILSDHAHSTMTELAKSAAEYGLKGFVETEHGPAIDGCPPNFFFRTTLVPKHKNGVRIYFGCEANIMSSTGDIDIFAEHLRNLDFVNAAMHDPCFPPSNRVYHTRSLLNAIKNPLIDCIAHPENPVFPVDMDTVVFAAAKYNKILEVNNNSFMVRPGGRKQFLDMLESCKEAGVRITVASDCHVDDGVGRVDLAMELIEEMNFPENLIINATMESFGEYLQERRTRVEEYVNSGEIIFDGCSI